MIGVFDSGDGGLCTVEKIRELAPRADICFLADRENAPYGTKTSSEIIKLTKRNIRILKDAGAQKILIACCSASSIYPSLTKAEKEIAVPIIDATVRRATEKTKSGKIGVIATTLTARSSVFEKKIKEILPYAEVFTEPMQELVALVESGVSDSNLKGRSREKLQKLLSKIKKYPIDTLILGCTHFPRLEKTISEIVGTDTVSSALEGAKEILTKAGGDGTEKIIFL